MLKWEARADIYSKNKDVIPVTKPFLPPIEEYQELVQGIFYRNWLTNDGPQLFIDEILQFLNVDSFPLTVPHSNESKSPQIKIETFPFEFTTLLKNHFLEKNRALEFLLNREIPTWK